MTLLTKSTDSEKSAKARVRNLSTRIRKADVVSSLCFLALAFYVTGRLWIYGEDVELTGLGTQDYNQFQWFFAHSVYVLTSFGDPFVSHRLNAPDGVNMMGNGSMMGIGIPLAPLTMVLGPSYTFVVATVLGLAGTSIGWYFLLNRRLHLNAVAAAVGAGLCGFGPGMISHADGHPSFVVAFMVPIILWRVFILTDNDRIWRNGIILGLCVVFQVFIGEETLFLTGVSCMIFFAVFAVVNWRTTQKNLVRFFAGVAVALLTSATLLAYPLWVQFFGPEHYDKLPLAPNMDALSYVAFPTYSLGGTLGRTQELMAVSPEENSFLGWPLLTLFAVGAVWLWRDLLARTIAITTAICGVLSLGPELRFRGQLYTNIPLPARYLNKLPLFDQAIPSRYGLVVMTLIGVLIAIMLHRAITEKLIVSPNSQIPVARTDSSPLTPSQDRTPSVKTMQWGWCAVAVVALLPLFPTPLPVQNRMPTPEFISSGAWRQYVNENDTLVTVPMPLWDTDAMRWAAEENHEFALPRGYFHGPYDETGISYFAPKHRPTSALLTYVRMTGVVPAVSDADRQRAMVDLRYWKASVVVLTADPREAQLLTTLEQLLGPGKRVQDVWLWDMRPII